MSDRARVLHRDPAYDAQLARTLAAAAVGAADLGEALATARRVMRPSVASWHRAWSVAAGAADIRAEWARTSGDPVGARQAWLRASEYRRQSYHFLRGDLDDPRVQRAHAEHVRCFGRAVDLMGPGAHAVRIPYEDTSLKGYLFTSGADRPPRPTVVLPCGYDSTAESGWVDVPDALERGWHALVFEGPGQGEALITQRLLLRPDFERVLTPVLDWLVGRPEVDASRLVLIGRSLGGYLAPRAAAHDHRVAALVCDPAQPDLGTRHRDGSAGAPGTAQVLSRIRPSAARAEHDARMAAHGAHTTEEYADELRRYTMLDVADRITCPTLIVESEHDPDGGGGGVLREALTCPTELVHLTAAEGADGACGGLGQRTWAAVVHGWLARTFPARDGTGCDQGHDPATSAPARTTARTTSTPGR